MTQVEKVLDTAKAHTTAGDGRLDVKLSSPGVSGTGANPEQLFGAGWSAGFLSAIRLAAGKKRIALPSGLAIPNPSLPGAQRTGIHEHSTERANRKDR